jgi:hypothetical protein
VAVAVARGGTDAADLVDTGDGAAAEVSLVESDSRVDDIRLYSGGGEAVAVRAVEGQASLVDAIETPGRAVLVGAGLDDLVTFDTGDAGVGSHLGQRLGREPGGEPVERGSEDLLDHGARLHGGACGSHRVRVVANLHDVVIRDGGRAHSHRSQRRDVGRHIGVCDSGHRAQRRRGDRDDTDESPRAPRAGLRRSVPFLRSIRMHRPGVFICNSAIDGWAGTLNESVGPSFAVTRRQRVVR